MSEPTYTVCNKHTFHNHAFIIPREHNFALNLFWCVWWPASFLAFPFLGRIWCSVCPFMIYGELVQRWRLSQGAQLLKWPREQMDRWGPWFLFAMFYGERCSALHCAASRC